jgi:hypothetical protein
MVEVVTPAPSADSYTVKAWSKSGNTFLITKDATTGALSRTCTSAGGNANAGCRGSTW